MIELDDLQCFLRVAEKGGVSAAARSLDAPKSSVSRSLSRLETNLGAALFDRCTGEVRLTEAGAALLPRARRVLADLDEAEDAVGSIAGEPRGCCGCERPTRSRRSWSRRCCRRSGRRTRKSVCR